MYAIIKMEQPTETTKNIIAFLTCSLRSRELFEESSTRQTRFFSESTKLRVDNNTRHSIQNVLDSRGPEYRPR